MTSDMHRPRRTLARRAVQAAVALSTLAVGLGLGGSTPAAATPVTHQIEIDGSPLFSRYFVVVGQGWLDANQLQTVTLNENQAYQIRTGNGAAAFTFKVDENGLVQYEEPYEAFLDGDGTGRLTLVGVDAAIDSRYLSGLGVLIANVPADNADWLRNQTVRLLPAASYMFQQSGGVIARVSVSLSDTGLWSYASQFAGYMDGNGTNKLTFYGYPLIVDARAAGGTGVLVQPLKGVSFTYTAVQPLVVLPATPFWLQIRGGEVTSVGFALENNGDITFDPALPLTVNTFHGLTRLTVTGAL